VASFWAACFLLNGVVFKDSKTKQNKKKKTTWAILGELPWILMYHWQLFLKDSNSFVLDKYKVFLL
jgi:hypothetical protein